MSNDNRSQVVGTPYGQIDNIAADGVYFPTPNPPIDTADLVGISFWMGSYFLADGNYRLAFDESDNGLDWSDLPEESLIGSAIVTTDIGYLVPYQKVGVFSCKRYLRPKVIASDVSIGCTFLGIFLFEAPRIIPEIVI